MTIHLARRRSGEGWVSFESDAHLSYTRQRIYTRCAPCLEGLLAQLTAGAATIHLQEAWNCWKVVAVLDNEELCLQVLAELDANHPGEWFFGKYGTGNPQVSTRVVNLHAEEVQRRDQLLEWLQQAVDGVAPGAKVFGSRACANPYQLLLGPWTTWRQETAIVNPGIVPEVIKRLRDMLYQRGQ